MLANTLISIYLLEDLFFIWTSDFFFFFYVECHVCLLACILLVYSVKGKPLFCVQFFYLLFCVSSLVLYSLFHFPICELLDFESASSCCIFNQRKCSCF